MTAPEPRDAEIPLSNGIDSITVCPAPGGQADLIVRTFHDICRRVPRAAVRVTPAGLPRRLGVICRPEFIKVADDPGCEALRVRVVDPGDALTYTFALVAPGTKDHFPHFDPFYSAINFRFRGDDDRGDCSGASDCRPAPADPATAGEVDYLVKDYAGFRRLMLERLSRTVPQWRDRNVPDLGVTLVEVLAYAADHLSYYQDAVATEAYLDTARRRVSVRRHARLVGYTMHQGCNARAWVCLEVNGRASISPEEIYFFTDPGGPGRPAGRPLIQEGRQLLSPAEADRVVFAPVVSDPSGRQAVEMEGLLPPWQLPERAKLELYPEHNEIAFYTDGKGEICLPRGATTARLYGRTKEARLLPNLRCGDVLIFEEVKGPRTGVPADADRTRRHAVRLLRVARAGTFVEVEWFEQDALPWPLCLRTQRCGCVSVARGNVVLVDNGLWRAESSRDLWGESGRAPAAAPCREGADAGGPPTGAATRSDGQRGAWWHAPLENTPLTHAAPFPDPRVTARIQAGYLDELRECLASGRAAPELLAWVDSLLRLARAGLVLHAGWVGLALRALAALLPRGRCDCLLPWMGHCPEGPGPWDPLHPIAYGPARDALAQRPRDCVAALDVRSPGTRRRWQARPDLLGQHGENPAVVADVDDEGLTHLRFDHETPGQAPAAGEPLIVSYRVGNGRAGNVGADRITGVIGTKQSFPGIKVRNPLPATGGTDPEPIETVKLMAPAAFRDEITRAITADDYANLAQRDERVQRAKARLVPTGAGLEAQVALDLTAQTLDRYGGRIDRVLREVQAYLVRFRRIGHDVRVVQARMVPVTVHLHVALAASARRVPAESALRGALGSGLRADGTQGLLHPDRLTFGDPVAESALVREAQQIDGVLWARVMVLARSRDLPAGGEASAALARWAKASAALAPSYDPPATVAVTAMVGAAGAGVLPWLGQALLTQGLLLRPVDGVLVIGPLEIARLDDDPARPENGRLTFSFEGGL